MVWQMYEGSGIGCAWHKQESFKGRIVSNDPVAWLSATGWCGWGFRSVMGTDPLTGKSFYIPVYSAAEANAMQPDDFRTDTVFNPSPTAMFSSNITFQTRNELLAKGIPALAPAAGCAGIFVQNRSLMEQDLNEGSYKPNGWGRSGNRYEDRWLHGDMKDMAYFYVYPLFYKLQGKVSPNEANSD